VTAESRHLVAAFHNLLSKLELTDAPGRDQKSYAELKRILNRRIQDLENCTAIPFRRARGAKGANNPG
jgi:hypothetical protein